MRIAILIRTMLVLGFMCALAPAALAQDAKGDSEGKVELPVELPNPVFGGTPITYDSPNFEVEDFKPREPFMAPEGVETISKDKPVTASTQTNFGKLEMITDGDKEAYDSSLVELKKGVQWVQIDLEESVAIYCILVWHYHAAERVYFDVVVQVSDDPKFEDDVTTVYNNDYDNSSGLGVGENNEYIDKYEGRLIPVDGVKARYVRLYSNGNTTDAANHYLEVEVYGMK